MKCENCPPHSIIFLAPTVCLTAPPPCASHIHSSSLPPRLRAQTVPSLTQFRTGSVVNAASFAYTVPSSPPASNTAAANDGFSVRFDLAINAFTVLKCVCTYPRTRDAEINEMFLRHDCAIFVRSWSFHVSHHTSLAFLLCAILHPPPRHLIFLVVCVPAPAACPAAKLKSRPPSTSSFSSFHCAVPSFGSSRC